MRTELQLHCQGVNRQLHLWNLTRQGYRYSTDTIIKHTNKRLKDRVWGGAGREYGRPGAPGGTAEDMDHGKEESAKSQGSKD